MGRQSKLTDKQWETIGKRLLNGESTSALAREYEVSKAAISGRFSERNVNIKTVANQVVEVERSLSQMNVSEQMAVRSLADDLKAISEHLASAARNGAETASHLSGLAKRNAAKVLQMNPADTESVETLKGVAILTKMANDSSQIGISLLQSNKEQIAQMNAAAREEANQKRDKPNMRPQLTKQEWLQAHGLGTTAGPAE